MNSVIVFAEPRITLGAVRDALQSIGRGNDTPYGGLAFDHGSGRIYVHPYDPGDEYETTELDVVADALGPYQSYAVDYSDIEVVKDVIRRITDLGACVVDNDHGFIASGEEYARRMREDPAWDWRIEYVAGHPLNE